mgnify:CR=1 FL=1
MTGGVQETSNPLREARVGDRRAAAKADPCVHRPRHLDRHKEPFLRLMISLDATEAQESEIYDLMGVVFDGHPNLKRVLLWEGFPGHPLRKDFP